MWEFQRLRGFFARFYSVTHLQVHAELLRSVVVNVLNTNLYLFWLGSGKEWNLPEHRALVFQHARYFVVNEVPEYTLSFTIAAKGERYAVHLLEVILYLVQLKSCHHITNGCMLFWCCKLFNFNWLSQFSVEEEQDEHSLGFFMTHIPLSGIIVFQ